MRKAKKALLASRKLDDVGAMDRSEARWEWQNAEGREAPDDDWVTTKAREPAERLARTFGLTLEENPEVFWAALEMYDHRLYSSATEYIELDEFLGEEWKVQRRDSTDF